MKNKHLFKKNKTFDCNIFSKFERWKLSLYFFYLIKKIEFKKWDPMIDDAQDEIKF